MFLWVFNINSEKLNALLFHKLEKSSTLAVYLNQLVMVEHYQRQTIHKLLTVYNKLALGHPCHPNSYFALVVKTWIDKTFIQSAPLKHQEYLASLLLMISQFLVTPDKPSADKLVMSASLYLSAPRNDTRELGMVIAQHFSPMVHEQVHLKFEIETRYTVEELTKLEDSKSMDQVHSKMTCLTLNETKSKLIPKTLGSGIQEMDMSNELGIQETSDDELDPDALMDKDNDAFQDLEIIKPGPIQAPILLQHKKDTEMPKFIGEAMQKLRSKEHDPVYKALRTLPLLMGRSSQLELEEISPALCRDLVLLNDVFNMQNFEEMRLNALTELGRRAHTWIHKVMLDCLFDKNVSINSKYLIVKAMVVICTQMATPLPNVHPYSFVPKTQAHDYASGLLAALKTTKNWNMYFHDSHYLQLGQTSLISLALLVLRAGPPLYHDFTELLYAFRKGHLMERFGEAIMQCAASLYQSIHQLPPRLVDESLVHSKKLLTQLLSSSF